AVYSSAQQRLPDDPWEQLSCSIEAVFRCCYQGHGSIPGLPLPRWLPPACPPLPCAVFGNINEHSGTGVAFTRNPATGERKLFGEFLINAQGEDVVAGVRTPLPIHTLADTFPNIFAELDDTTRKLEAHLQDMQDVEFTVQDGRLFMLQCRNGKRTGAAALQIATDMVQEGLINRQQALSMVQPTHLEQLLHPRFCDEKAYRDAGNVLAKGLAASPGAAVGRLVFTAADAEAWHAKGEAVVLCREETSPEDVGGMHAAQGIVTARGGMTSHAAVVARGWGKPCVCGVEALEVDESKKTVVVRPAGAKAVTLREGDWVSLNGTTGEVIRWMQPVQAPEMVGALAQFMGWVDSTRRLQVFANADTPADAQKARENGAQGVGLCRTEHMFFSTPARIAAVRRMIAAEQLASPEKAAALEELAAYQTADFEGIFRAMDGLPVTIRLLDPPLHEFLPHAGPALQALCKQLAKELNSSQAIVKGRLEALREANPMMGLRGCRLGIIHPEISSMQARAVFQAASHVVMARGRVFPHIMVPLVGSVDELNCQVALIKQAAAQVQAETGVTIPFRVGTMIEVPRAALLAGKLAASAEFFSFGSNDLTQMTFGISRDDAQAKFLSFYITNGILPADPFETLDQEGVGEMIRIAVKRGRAARPDLGLGVCGEHAGDPASIAFFDQVGLDYVSCSPLRVPVARLAAAQAAAGRAGATPERPAAPAKDPHQVAATNGTKNAAVQLRIDTEGAGVGESRTQHVHTGPSTP
ncbi:putative Pyruvate, phosphate dikinase chloroplast precursor, partial [Haematococcus lacustris]